ncbi:MAG: hypothetical protein KGQ59_03390 [Bdellovibrionales bacterium]|nr:hypothetical protein [Bdellovibrionales bacterium]
MGRPHGFPKTGGRKRGTPNRRSDDFSESLFAAGIHPIEELGRILSSDKLSDSERASILLSLLPYIYPKRKAVEVAAKESFAGGDVEYVAIWGRESPTN